MFASSNEVMLSSGMSVVCYYLGRTLEPERTKMSTSEVSSSRAAWSNDEDQYAEATANSQGSSPKRDKSETLQVESQFTCKYEANKFRSMLANFNVDLHSRATLRAFRLPSDLLI